MVREPDTPLHKDIWTYNTPDLRTDPRRLLLVSLPAWEVGVAAVFLNPGRSCGTSIKRKIVQEVHIVS